MKLGTRFSGKGPAAAVLVAGLAAFALPAAPARGADLDSLIGCWTTKEYVPTSLESDSTRADGHTVIRERSLLIFGRIAGTKYLVFGRLYEWDRKPTYILGPTYQNGAYDPVARTVTFGFPGGGLDTARLLPDGQLLYVHAKSISSKSAMSVRHMERMNCAVARRLELELLDRQKTLPKR